MKKTGRYREFFVKLGNHSQVYRNQVSLLTALAYTTEPGELDAIAVLQKRYGNLGTALGELVDIIGLLNHDDKSDSEVMDLLNKRYSDNGKLDERLRKFIVTKTGEAAGKKQHQ